MLNKSDVFDIFESEQYLNISWDYYYDPIPERYAAIWMLSFFSIAGTVGNAIVLYVFYKKKDQQVSTLFIIILAFVDFTTCLIVIPYTIILESRRFVISSNAVCKIYHFMVTSNIPFSDLIMVAIAIDRYLCICHPFLHALNLRRAKILTVILGIFSACIGIIVSLMHGIVDQIEIPSVLSEEYQYGNITSDYASTDFEFEENLPRVRITGEMCFHTDKIISEEFRTYFQRYYMVLYVVSLVIVVILYALIYYSVMARRSRRARQKSKALPLVKLQNEHANMSTVEETLLTQVNGDDKIKVDAGHAAAMAAGENADDVKGKVVKGHLNRKSTKKDNNYMANLKTAAMLFVVAVVFVITFAPALLMTLKLIPVNQVVWYMYFANNVANPVIYSFMNKNFRDDLKKIFCKPRRL